MSKPIADLHCHPSLKPHLNPLNSNDPNQIGIPDIWTYAENKTVKELYKNFSIRKWIMGGMLNKMADQTQSNLDSCFAGDNRLLFCSIYPFERPFLNPDRPFKRASTLLKLGLQLLLKKAYNWKGRV